MKHFLKKGPQNRNAAFQMKSDSLIHKFEFYEHKLVCCSFLVSASNGISFGIN